MLEKFHAWLTGLGVPKENLPWAGLGIAVLGLAIAAYLANFITKKIILRAVRHIATRTRTDWDNILVQEKFFSRFSHLAPALVIWIFAPQVLTDFPELGVSARRLAEIYMILVGIFVLDALLSGIARIYSKFDVATRVPIRGYLQVVKIIVGFAAGIFVLSIILGKSPWVFFSGLGAVSAILLLIFKDSILGFVAGIQLGANDMVRPGDWIEMPKYGADGDVMEVSLHTVKVRNWDKTISTIPSYALISDSFRNWRGMEESGGRRIKRALHLDVASIKFCSPEMIERLSRIELLRDYIETKQRELAAYNTENGIDESVLVNGRRMTNVGTFRAYVVAYLRRHPKINHEMTFLVRQLKPTDIGLPIEIYVFSSDQAWVAYEAIQADIFDHLFAALPEFELRPFQRPTGADLATWIGGSAAAR